MKFLKNRTMLVVALFVVFFTLLVVLSERAEAEIRPFVGLGHGILHHKAPAQAFGVLINDRYELQAIHFGADEDRGRGEIPGHWAFTASRLAYTPESWLPRSVRVYAKLGLTYIDGRNPLVGCHAMYNLGLGVRLWGVLYLGEEHISSAGVCRPNTGVDFIALKLSHSW